MNCTTTPPRVLQAALILTAMLGAGCATTPSPMSHPLPEGHPPVDSGSAIAFRDRQAEAYATFIRGVMLSGEGNAAEAAGYLQMSSQLDSTSPAVWLELMRTFRDTGNREGAEKSARKVLDLDPEAAEAHAALGQLLVDSDRTTDAIGHLLQAVELDPENATSHFLLAEALEKTGDIEGAVGILEKLARSGEHEALANYYVARVRAVSGDVDGALPNLARAVALNPSFLKAVEELGNLLEQKRDAGHAEKLYLGYLEKDPDAGLVREFLAKFYLRTERYDEARAQLRKVLEGAGENHSAKLLMGMVEYQDGNLEKALELFDQVREVAPDSFDMTMQIGTLQRELKMYGEATATFEDAAALAPNRYEPFLNMAVIHDATGDLAGAVPDLETALALEPDRANLRIYFAQVLQRLERPEDAVRLLNEGLERSPDEPALLYQLAITYDQTGRFDKAEKTLLHLIEVKPDHYDAMNYLGYSWADRNMRLEEARDLVQQALELKPDAAYIIDSLGWVYFRLGRFEEALEQLLKAGEKMGDDATILEHIGDVYDKLGKEDLAVQFWSLALQADPGNARLKEKLEDKGAVETSP